MSSQERDENFMRQALAEALKSVGRTSPNPAVGAVIVRGEEVIARGHHRAAGEPHAEIEALRAVPQTETGAQRGAEMFVTLEPCSTTGRTGACTSALIEAGLKRVVIGTIDPNPAHAGAGVEILRNAGIEVDTGVLEPECRELNAAFHKWIVSGRPLVIAKAAITLDGHLTRRRGEGRWITSPEARDHAHRTLRARVDAILIGANTLRQDDPALTVRLPGDHNPPSRQPRRIILTRSGELPETARVFTDQYQALTEVYRNRPLGDVLADLGARQMTSVLLEGGAQVLTEAFRDDLVDRVQFYIAPILAGQFPLGDQPIVVGDLPASLEIEAPQWQQIGRDVCLTGAPSRKN